MGVLEPFFCFVCSDGKDVIRAFHDVFNAGAELKPIETFYLKI